MANDIILVREKTRGALYYDISKPDKKMHFISFVPYCTDDKKQKSVWWQDNPYIRDMDHKLELTVCVIKRLWESNWLYDPIISSIYWGPGRKQSQNCSLSCHLWILHARSLHQEFQYQVTAVTVLYLKTY